MEIKRQTQLKDSHSQNLNVMNCDLKPIHVETGELNSYINAECIQVDLKQSKI